MIDKDIEMTIKIPNIDQIRERMKGMENKATTAMRNSINRTISVMGGFISKEASDRYVVKQSAVTKTLRRHKARVSDLTGLVESDSKTNMPLKGFRISPAKADTRPAVYRAKVKKSSSLKPLIGDSAHSKAFIARMKAGHGGLFQRKLGVAMDKQQRVNPQTGKPVQRRPGSKPYIKNTEMRSISIPQMVGSEESAKVIRDKGFEYLHKRLNHEIKRIMEGIK